MAKKTLRSLVIIIYALSALLAFLANFRNHNNSSDMILLASWMVILFLIFDLVFDYGVRRFNFEGDRRGYFNSMLWSFIVSIFLSLLEFRETSFGLTLLNKYLPLASHFLNLYAFALYFRARYRKK